MTALFYLLGVVVFIAGVALSIGLHEMGHLIPGKLFDVKITQYFIGFGRTLWSRRRGETEYGVKAIPFGGYVKLVGMLPPGDGDDPGTVRSRNTGMFAQLVSDARAAEYEHVGPHDHDRLFYTQPWWKRVIIMGCGVAINLVLAFILLGTVFMAHGVDEADTSIGTVSKCVKVVHEDQAPGPCTAKDPETPAAEAGLLPGDRILSFNGTRIGDYEQLQDAIRANGARSATIGVERGGKQLTLHADTVVNVLPSLSDPSKSVRAGFLGISPQVTLQRQGLGYTAQQMVDSTWQSIQAVGRMPVNVFRAGKAALGLEKRDPNGPMSIVGAGRIAGDIASDQDSLSDKLFELVALLGSLNLFLGVINLVPLPPFDGGGIATTLYEAARRGIARLLGRPDPGGVDSAKLLPVTYAMATLLLIVSFVLVVADVVAPVPLS